MREIIGLIYETIAAPEAWDEVLARMADGLGASAALFFKPVPGAPELLAQRNIIPALLDEYLAYYHAKDILVRSSIGREHELAGRALRVEYLMAEASFRKSEFFNDFLRRHAIADVLSSPIVDPAAPSAPPPILGFYRPPRARRFSEVEVRRMQECLPHIERALRLRGSIAREVPAWTDALIEQLPAGVFVMNGRGRVVHANGAARAIVDERDGLGLSDGKLYARGGGSALDAAVAAALSVAPVGRDLLVARRSGAAWLVSVCPLSRPEAERHWGGSAARVWVHVVDPRAAPAGLPARLAALFGLTGAEARVAHALLLGLSTAEIAEAHSVSLATIRTQMQAIFGRLGVTRQAKLVNLLRGVAVLRDGNHST